MELFQGKIEVNGNTYTMHKYQKTNWNGETYYEGYLWDSTGGTCLCSGENYKSIEEFEKEKDIAIANWEQGKLRCSHCGEIIDYAENSGHRYFAGIYCQHCWDTKYREIEANETYN
jgi:hypothetical protein